MSNFFLFGLGNPGRRFAKTRHNVGAMALMQLARKLNIKLKQREFESLAGDGEIEGKKLTLLLPQGYMNRSGHTVEGFVGAFKVPLENILIICDDINLPLGTIRVRARGSAGGHNGLSSIIEALGTSIFPRLRIGIKGRTPLLTSRNSQSVTGRTRAQDLSDYVLSPFKRSEAGALQDALDDASCAIYSWLVDGIQRAMSQYNKRAK